MLGRITNIHHTFELAVVPFSFALLVSFFFFFTGFALIIHSIPEGEKCPNRQAWYGNDKR
jgi:hypothetical protein